MPEVKIHLELILPAERLGVNALIVLFQELLKQLVPRLVAAWLAAWQDWELERWLGARWQSEPQRSTPWVCPRCRSDQGFQRRGSRPRVLRQTSLGRIKFELRQVTCQRCEATFAPLTTQLELASYQVSTTEFRARAAEAACQVSYQRSATMVSQSPLTASVSATAIHAWVQQQGEGVTFPAEPAAGRTLLLDGTKLKAGTQEHGVPLNVGMALVGRTTAGGRPQLIKRVVAFGLDEAWGTTLHPLADITPERVIFDGDPAVRAAIETLWPHTFLQRCSWHLPHQLYYALRKDGLTKTDCEPLQNRLVNLLYDGLTLGQARAAYQALCDEMQLEGLTHGAHYLCDAQPHVFTFREYPEGILTNRAWLAECSATLATSPLEREMREINRRTDDGSHWSVPGARHLVGLDLVRRYDAAQWQQCWHLSATSCSSGSVLILKVQTKMVGPALNVKTT